jgi:hypothetical protein
VKKLAYIHIEKSAGTAWRALFHSNFGEDKVFWFAGNHGVRKSLPQWVKQCWTPSRAKGVLVVGGHLGWSFYGQPAWGYIGICRHPGDRVASLYNYLRKKEWDVWSRHGLDRNSLERTLEQSPLFRRLVKNSQCEYLSGYGNFEATLRHIRSHNYLVARLESVTLVASMLSQKLDLKDSRLKQQNAGIAGYREQLDINANAQAMIADLTGEDQALFDYISSQPDGIFCSISDRNWADYADECSRQLPCPSLKIELACLEVVNGRLIGEVVIHNQTEDTLNTKGELVLVMLARSPSGEPVTRGRVRITHPIPPGAAERYSVQTEDSVTELHITDLHFAIRTRAGGNWEGPDKVRTLSLPLASALELSR